METEEPVTTHTGTPGRSEKTTTTHPAYAQIRANRVSGMANLYGSDFVHQHYINITIAKSDFDRDLHHDWYHAGKELIEVSLSEAQWATFVSSMNCGSGVPCTIDHIDGKRAPRLPHPISRADQFSDEMRGTMKRATVKLKELQAGLATMGLPKKKTAEIIGAISSAISDMECNTPFVAKCFDEHVENAVEAAKVEIHGYMTGALQRAGIAALTSQEETPLLLTND